MEENELDKITPDARVYEVGYHIIPSVVEADLGIRVTAVRDAIEAAGGRMIADEYPKHVDLAYPMVKLTANKRATHHSAYFGWMKFDAEPKGVKTLETALKKDEFILRFILIKTVRENTMAPKKVFREKRAEEVPRAKEAVAEKPVMSEAELDKTIEELVIS
ncbi:MAG: 30S ribosomal protein S6 [bacterium]|nr:30S ribosomal protein S6 [bacterium]